MVLQGVNGIGLKGDHRVPGGGVELGAIASTEDDRPVQEDEVDGEDGGECLDGDRHPPDLDPTKEAEALFGVENIKSGSIKLHNTSWARGDRAAVGTFGPSGWLSRRRTGLPVLWAPGADPG